MMLTWVQAGTTLVPTPFRQRNVLCVCTTNTRMSACPTAHPRPHILLKRKPLQERSSTSVSSTLLHEPILCLRFCLMLCPAVKCGAPFGLESVWLKDLAHHFVHCRTLSSPSIYQRNIHVVCQPRYPFSFLFVTPVRATATATRNTAYSIDP